MYTGRHVRVETSLGGQQLKDACPLVKCKGNVIQGAKITREALPRGGSMDKRAQSYYDEAKIQSGSRPSLWGRRKDPQTNFGVELFHALNAK